MMCVCVCKCAHVCTMMWRSEVSFEELLLFFYLCALLVQDQNDVTNLYVLGHFACTVAML